MSHQTVQKYDEVFQKYEMWIAGLYTDLYKYHQEYYLRWYYPTKMNTLMLESIGYVESVKYIIRNKTMVYLNF